VPQNGLANRLQAIASGILLANELGMTLKVHWIVEKAMPISSNEIFDEKTLLEYFISPEESNVYNEIVEKAKYFVSLDANYIVVKGMRLGEQRLMNKLKNEITNQKENLDIVVISGGKFLLNRNRFFTDSSTFRTLRKEVYNQLKFHKKILENVDALQKQLGKNYVAVHLRGTDRISETIKIKKFIKLLKLDLNKIYESIFICGDSYDRRMALQDLLEKTGFNNIVVPEIDFSRSTVSGIQDAAADWLVLSKAKKIIFSEGTTFSYEAAVAGGVFSNSVILKQNRFYRFYRKSVSRLKMAKLYKQVPF